MSDISNVLQHVESKQNAQNITQRNLIEAKERERRLKSVPVYISPKLTLMIPKSKLKKLGINYFISKYKKNGNS